jgi:hypothetical protein
VITTSISKTKMKKIRHETLPKNKSNIDFIFMRLLKILFPKKKCDRWHKKLSINTKLTSKGFHDDQNQRLKSILRKVGLIDFICNL